LLRYLFILVALTCLGDYFYLAIDREVYQERENRSFDGRLSEATTTPAGDSARATAVPRTVPNTAAIGRISVPRLGIRAMVDDGVDDDTLSHAVGHLRATAYPGQAGNVAVAGHRDTFFRELRHLEKNDEIDFETRSGNFRYRVESMMIVDPANISVIAPTSEKMLTIVTCYPFNYIGNAPRRFVVHARQTGEYQ